MFIEETINGGVSFSTYVWDLGKDRFYSLSASEQVNIIFDIFSSITALSNSYGINYAGSHYGDTSYKISKTDKFYYPEFPPELYEDGLEQTSIEVSLFSDNYLSFLQAALGYISLSSMVDQAPNTSGCVSNTPSDYFANVSIVEHSYSIDGQVALLRSKTSRNITLTTELPNFDIALVQSRDAGPRTKVYNLVETGRGSMTLMINILAQYLICNFHPFALCELIKLAGFEGNFEKIKEVLAKVGQDGAAFEGKIVSIKRNTQLINWVIGALKRQLYANMPTNAYELLLGPDANAQIAKNISLQNYMTSCQILKDNLKGRVVFEYRLMRFSSQEFTPSPDSRVASTSTTQTLALAENGTLCKLDSSFKVIQSEQLYKIMRLIKRKIVTKRGIIKTMNIYSSNDQIIFENLPDPILPGDGADPLTPLERSIVIHKSASIPTMSWDDAISLSRVIPRRVSQVSESYRYKVVNKDSDIEEVVNAFKKAMDNEMIQSFSIDYDPLTYGGTYNVSYITTAF